MKYLRNDNKVSLDKLKEEEETPEKKIDFVSPFVGSINRNVIPTHLLKAYTSLLSYFSNSAGSEKSKYLKMFFFLFFCQTRKNNYSAFKSIFLIPTTFLLPKLIDPQPLLSF